MGVDARAGRLSLVRAGQLWLAQAAWVWPELPGQALLVRARLTRAEALALLLPAALQVPLVGQRRLALVVPQARVQPDDFEASLGLQSEQEEWEPK